MKGVLILAHGSKRKETEERLGAVTDMLKSELQAYGMCGEGGIAEIETAFLQFSERDLHNGLSTLAKSGADEILVIPYFLFDGTHIKEDIPNEISAFTEQNPDVRVRLCGTLGADKRLAMILKDRIVEASS